MKHGGVSTTSDNNSSSSSEIRATSDEFGRAVAKLAVAQICESMGFDSFHNSALDSLADIAVRYLLDLGKAAGFYANLSGRTQCNVFDIIRGLEDLGDSLGFLGASRVSSSSNCVVSGSGVMREIINYVDFVEELPFAQPIPCFPVHKERRLIPSFDQMGETPPGKHIPSWLPALPDPHTYKQTPMWIERKSDLRADKLEQARQRRKAERSLLNLQQRLAFCHDSAGPSTSGIGHDDAVEGDTNPKPNLYLAEPLRPGDKEVSVVELPEVISNGPDKETQNHVSVLETFAPAIEAMKDRFCDDDNVENSKVLPDKRPAVHFKFKTGKKVLGQSWDLTLRNKVTGKSASLIGREEDRDDKKRRAEYILRQSIENPQELTLL